MAPTITVRPGNNSVSTIGLLSGGTQGLILGNQGQPLDHGQIPICPVVDAQPMASRHGQSPIPGSKKAGKFVLALYAPTSFMGPPPQTGLDNQSSW